MYSAMTVRKLLVLSAVVATAFVSQPASAGIISYNTAVGGAPEGANKINFDLMTLGSAGGSASGPSGSAVVSFTGDAKIVSGSVEGQYAAPYLSGDNGNGFAPDGSNQANGQDATRYVTSGKTPSTAKIAFTTDQQFFGLLWGSVDDYNTLTFYNALNEEVGKLTGAQVINLPTGNQGEQGTVYVNINVDPFRYVVASSTNYAFEFDNVSYKETPLSVPDGGTTLALLGLGLTGMGLLRRRLQ